MKRKRRTEFTIETERRVTVQGDRNWMRGWCENCGRQVLMVKPEEAAFRCGVSVSTILRWLEVQRIHASETATEPWICSHSLVRTRKSDSPLL